MPGVGVLRASREGSSTLAGSMFHRSVAPARPGPVCLPPVGPRREEAVVGGRGVRDRWP